MKFAARIGIVPSFVHQKSYTSIKTAANCQVRIAIIVRIAREYLSQPGHDPEKTADIRILKETPRSSPSLNKIHTCGVSTADMARPRSPSRSKSAA